jgi:Protein tyrosine phosphatase-like protein, PTPLA
MIMSWASVEVPRYLFYVSAIITGDATKKTPYPLFWLRYSLFAILYPTGITGELTVFLAAGKDAAFGQFIGAGFASALYTWFLPAIYIFGAPFMLMNMVGNRKKAMKARFARPPPPPRGLVWPLDHKGERSSTDVNKAIFAAALGAVSPEREAKIHQSKSWRFGYVKHMVGMVEEQCASPAAALAVAQAGLDKAYDLFQFVSPDGSSVTMKEAMASKNSDKFCTGFVKGEGVAGKKVLEVPYKGQTLSGQALKDQVQKWVEYGTIEPSAGEAIQKCVDNPGWLDLSDRYFVLLGAGSAMGPFLVLMALGANVVAIDLDRSGIWQRLIQIAKKSSGSITFPMKKEQTKCKDDEELYANAGSNLFTETPMIRDWLVDLYPGKKFAVGSYAYLDGALHVQVSLAMDAICRDLSEKRNASLAYLCTPTDLHLIPKEAHDASEAYFQDYSKKLYCIVLRMLGHGKFLRKNARKPVSGEGGDFYFVNGISVAQGPNYALAKRMQHWRAIVARSKGCIVSSNIAPATSTVSVVSNRTFAWAYEGMPYFKPYEIFAPETSNAVMSALLLFDLNDPSSAGNPKTKLSNPNQLFQSGSFHGGNWRCAYEVDSIGEASVFIYFGRLAMPYVPVGVAAVAAVTAKVLGYF